VIFGAVPLLRVVNVGQIRKHNCPTALPGFQSIPTHVMLLAQAVMQSLTLVTLATAVPPFTFVFAKPVLQLAQSPAGVFCPLVVLKDEPAVVDIVAVVVAVAADAATDEDKMLDKVDDATLDIEAD
jgi:LytS/YehU family sensor histidine kinase